MSNKKVNNSKTSKTESNDAKVVGEQVVGKQVVGKQVVEQQKVDEKAELLKAALLGTQRYDLNVPDAKSELGKLSTLLSSADPQQRLLSLAGAYYLRQRAGEQPHQVSFLAPFHINLDAQSATDSIDKQQTTETQRPCNRLASQNLAAMLWGHVPDLLSEFLTALAKNNQRVPNQYLPTILARGVNSATIRPSILSALGHSGRWLATQNPDWSYATYDAATYDGAQTLLKQLPSAKRQPFLRQLRQTDPALVRQLLRNQWKTLSSSDRALFIKTMDEGLSIEDEPFLELSLNDRNNVVRRKSAELLARLADSQLCARMIENTKGFLSWSPEEEIRIKVKFPDEITPQMVKDGVMLRKLRDDSRTRAYQMKEMVGAISLDHWSDTWQATPAEIIAAARTSRWPRTLKQSFVIAAERQKNVEWAEALLADDQYGISSVRLINLLPIESCEKILKSVTVIPPALADGSSASAESAPLTKDSLIVRILRKRRDPWTEEIVTCWIDQLVAHIIHDIEQRKAAEIQIAKNKAPVELLTDKKNTATKTTLAAKSTVKTALAEPVVPPKKIDPILRLLIRQSGRCAPVEMTPQVVEKLRPFLQEFNVWRPTLQELISTLKFRQTMLHNIEMTNL